MQLKLLSWNVNGIRACHKKDFIPSIQGINPDIFGLQEIKATEDQIPIEVDSMPGYQTLYHPADRKGYSGTAIFSKIPILEYSVGINNPAHEGEGRVITVKYEKFYLVNVYTPNSKSDLARLDNRQEWDQAFFDYIIELEKELPVIVCGDLNVAHKEIDLANPKTNHFSAGFTDEERAGFQRYIDHGFIDTFRVFDQSPHKYSWWSYRTNSRARNVGWRIDYFLVSQSLKDNLKDAKIFDNIHGSDHCPVYLELEF